MNDRSSRWIIEEDVEDKGPSTPEWFEKAIADAPSSHHLSVEGCDIHYLRWGPAAAEKPGILFVHGGAAHAQWWSFIAPFFAADRPVAAIDLSGCGDSGRRKEYTSAQRVAEMAAVIDDAGLGAKPVVVGHSFGGYMTMCFGHHHGADLSGVVIVDSALRPPSDEDEGPSGGPGRPKPYFPNKDTIVRRYRLSPWQPCENEYLVQHIAQHAVVEEAQGWTWKYDDNARGRGRRDEPLADYLRDMACPKALFYGTESVLMAEEALAYTKEQFKTTDPFVAVPAAGHHLTLDQPLAFVVGLRSILAGWDA
jgi:pimeloyl-ACP methyl ester carboxylesterase